MKIKGTNFAINRNSAGEIWYNLGTGWKQANHDQHEEAKSLLEFLIENHGSIEASQLNEMRESILSKEITEDTDPFSTSSQIDLEDLINKVINFFSEFSFEPNYRFLNTFAYATKEDKSKEYVKSYFELTDSPFLNTILEKMNSIEFENIIRQFKAGVNPTSKINKRFKLYYGSQGTGKTTKASEEVDYVVNCHSSVLPADLMEDFDFSDGKAEFKPSVLYKAMENGQKVLLDEINLLPFDSLRFLQSILDGKEKFNYKGREVNIKEGFEVIGTMNLVVNGSVFGLPEPLVDRASELRKFELKASDLLPALN